jgi:hypothetical protein
MTIVTVQDHRAAGTIPAVDTKTFDLMPVLDAINLANDPALQIEVHIYENPLVPGEPGRMFGTGHVHALDGAKGNEWALLLFVIPKDLTAGGKRAINRAIARAVHQIAFVRNASALYEEGLDVAGVTTPTAFQQSATVFADEAPAVIA